MPVVCRGAGYSHGSARDNVLTYRCGGRLGHPSTCTSAPLVPELTLARKPMPSSAVAVLLSQATVTLANGPLGPRQRREICFRPPCSCHFSLTGSLTQSVSF